MQCQSAQRLDAMIKLAESEIGVVLSVDKAARTLQVQYAADPNCGFLSFDPGVPKN